MEKKKFVLIFDIPKRNFVLQKRVNRDLHVIEAEKLQQSVWRFDKLQY